MKKKWSAPASVDQDLRPVSDDINVVSSASFLATESDILPGQWQHNVFMAELAQLRQDELLQQQIPSVLRCPTYVEYLFLEWHYHDNTR